MVFLDLPSQQLLALLVARLPTVRAGDPGTYISYSDVHNALGLSLEGPTYGESLKHQGLSSLADWTAETNKPAITGLIIDRTTLMPGEGFFRLFGRTSDDFRWWQSEIDKAKTFNWAPYLPDEAIGETPPASDVESPNRVPTTTYRILRDTALAKRIKLIHRFECQLCGHTIHLPNGARYAEAHHIRPLGAPHNGPDIPENILCLCPNHHAELDYGVRELSLADIEHNADHEIGAEYVAYHNEVIRRSVP